MSGDRAQHSPRHQPDLAKSSPLNLDARLALSLAEAARTLGVSERHLRSILPELPHLHLGARVVIPVDALREWLRGRAENEDAASQGLADEILRELER